MQGYSFDNSVNTTPHAKVIKFRGRGGAEYINSPMENYVYARGVFAGLCASSLETQLTKARWGEVTFHSFQHNGNIQEDSLSETDVLYTQHCDGNHISGTFPLFEY